MEFKPNYISSSIIVVYIIYITFVLIFIDECVLKCVTKQKTSHLSPTAVATHSECLSPSLILALYIELGNLPM